MIARPKTAGEFPSHIVGSAYFELRIQPICHTQPFRFENRENSHRIGQKKPVTIIKMVTEGTVDEDIYKIQERKSRMNDAIMEEEGSDSKKSNESDEMCRLANAAVERFLKSPKWERKIMSGMVLWQSIHYSTGSTLVYKLGINSIQLNR